MKEFKTIKENLIGEIEEKKSKFIAYIFYIENEEEAKEKITEIKRKHYDARHNCYAYRVLENDMIICRSSDDGEPSRNSRNSNTKYFGKARNSKCCSCCNKIFWRNATWNRRISTSIFRKYIKSIRKCKLCNKRKRIFNRSRIRLFTNRRI